MLPVPVARAGYPNPCCSLLLGQQQSPLAKRGAHTWRAGVTKCGYTRCIRQSGIPSCCSLLLGQQQSPLVKRRAHTWRAGVTKCGYTRCIRQSGIPSQWGVLSQNKGATFPWGGHHTLHNVVTVSWQQWNGLLCLFVWLECVVHIWPRTDNQTNITAASFSHAIHGYLTMF